MTSRDLILIAIVALAAVAIGRVAQAIRSAYLRSVREHRPSRALNNLEAIRRYMADEPVGSDL